MYADSLETYNSAMSIIDTQTNVTYEEKWKKVKRDIGEEIQAVTRLLNTVNQFKGATNRSIEEVMPQPQN